MNQTKLFTSGPNEKQLELARHILVLDGPWFDIRHEIGDSEFEQLIEQETIRIANSLPEYTVNSEPAYGTTREDMKCFRNNQRGNYEALEKIVIGLNNCKVHHKILRELNTSEILGLYLGVGQLKSFGRIRSGKQDVAYNGFMPEDFVKQMSLLVSYGYRYNGIRIMKKRGFKSHPNAKGQLQARMSYVKSQLRESFIESLKKSTKVSDRRDKHNGFGDPNQEGLRDWTARNIYINHIVRRLEQSYQKNTKE